MKWYELTEVTKMKFILQNRKHLTRCFYRSFSASTDNPAVGFIGKHRLKSSAGGEEKLHKIQKRLRFLLSSTKMRQNASKNSQRIGKMSINVTEKTWPWLKLNFLKNIWPPDWLTICVQVWATWGGAWLPTWWARATLSSCMTWSPGQSVSLVRISCWQRQTNF